MSIVKTFCVYFFSIWSVMKVIHVAYTIIQQFVWIRLIGQLIVNILCIIFSIRSMMKVIHFAYTIIQQIVWIRLIQVGQLIIIEYIFFLMMKMIHFAYTIIQQFVWIRLKGQLIVNDRNCYY